MTFTPPTVKLFHSSCDPGGDSHTTIQLLCLISDYTPGDIDIVWLIDGQKVDEQFPQHGLVKQEGKLASTHSELNITQGQWASENTYTCQVTYKDMIFKDQARKCTGTAPAPPNIDTRHSGLRKEGRTQPHTALFPNHRV